MSISKADTEELFAVASECDVLLVEALWTRFFPLVAQAREELLRVRAQGGDGNIATAS